MIGATRMICMNITSGTNVLPLGVREGNVIILTSLTDEGVGDVGNMTKILIHSHAEQQRATEMTVIILDHAEVGSVEE